MAVLIHREIVLSKLSEGDLEVQNPSLAVAEKLSLKDTPDPMSPIVRHTNDVLEFGGENAMDPRKHHLIHQEPILRRVRDRREDMIGEGVAAQGLQDLVAPPRVLSGVRRENVGDHGPDAGEGGKHEERREESRSGGGAVAATRIGAGARVEPGAVRASR
jgi:hypothetical protein